jgi:hypothetical protein
MTIRPQDLFVTERLKNLTVEIGLNLQSKPNKSGSALSKSWVVGRGNAKLGEGRSAEQEIKVKKT